MYRETLELFAKSAKTKAELSKNRLVAYLVHSSLAGVYVGLGIILIFILSTPFFEVQSPAVGLIMGATFGLALSLVIIAGSDLFTGNVMIMPVGCMSHQTTMWALIRVWIWSYIGNFLGSIFVAYCAWKANVFHDPNWVLTVAAIKMSGTWTTLFFKGMLCNWLVVLALWSAARVKSESAKLIMIWWCLLGFIGSGYEHSIANMTLLCLANFLPNDGSHSVSWFGMLHNLIPVTLGNIVSGALFVGIAYCYITPFSFVKKSLPHSENSFNENR